MRTRSALMSAIALSLATGAASAQVQTETRQPSPIPPQTQQQTSPTEWEVQPRGQAQQQGRQQSQQQSQQSRRDPVPLPDVPEAVVEELANEDALDGLQVPNRLRRNMQEGPYAPPNENQPEIRAGGQSGAPVANIDDSRELPPEATDADREYYPGQPAYARQGDTDGAIPSGGLIGTGVRDAQGNEIGTVEDLLFSGDGISHAVVALDSELLGEERRVAIPWRDLNANRLNGDVQVSIPLANLVRSPDYAYEGEAASALD